MSSKLDKSNQFDKALHTLVTGDESAPIKPTDSCELCDKPKAAAALYDNIKMQLCRKCAIDIEAVFPVNSHRVLEAFDTITDIQLTFQRKLDVISSPQDGTVKARCYGCGGYIKLYPQDMYKLTGYPICDKCKEKNK